MSVLTIGGRRFAAGLYWLERGGAASVARNARAFKRRWHVHWGEQTGYAADEESPKDCPSLAASLQARIATPTWMALVEADDGRLALVKARDGAFLADGDEVFADREAALAAFERARGETNSSSGPEGSSVPVSSAVPESSSVPVSSTVPESSSVGWALHATPGLVKGDVSGSSPASGRSPVPGRSPVSEIEPTSLTDDPAMRLAAAPLSMLGMPKVGRFLALAVMLAGGAFVWTQRGTLWDLIAGPEEAAEAEQAPAVPPVTAILDAGALLAGCRQALMAYPPYMPAWRTERISCEGRFADIALIGVRPELEDRAVLTVRWRLGSGRPEPLHRRIAEMHLSDWYAASVTGDRAWAVTPLEPVLRLGEATPPSLLDFREAMDRHFGTRGTRIEYPMQGDGIEVRVTTGRVPFRLADAIAAVPGLELVRLIRDGAGEWRFEGRRVSPVSIPRERFVQAVRPLTESVTQSVAQRPAKLAGAATDLTGAAAGEATDTAGDAAGSAVNHTANDGGSGS